MKKILKVSGACVLAAIIIVVFIYTRNVHYYAKSDNYLELASELQPQQNEDEIKWRHANHALEDYQRSDKNDSKGKLNELSSAEQHANTIVMNGLHKIDSLHDLSQKSLSHIICESFYNGWCIFGCNK